MINSNHAVRADGSSEVSETGGWVTEVIGANQTESWGVPWLKKPNYRGPATSIDAVLALPIAFEPFTPQKQYYIEIAEGLSAGHRFEIDEAGSGGNVVAVDLASTLNTTATLPVLNGELIRIREHWTVNEVFDKALFHGASNQATPDRVLFWNGSGYTTLWYLKNAGYDKWVQSGDATLADKGSRVVPPGEGWFVQPKAAMNGLLPGWGLVRDHSFRQVLNAGTSFVSLGFPLTLTPTTNHLLIDDGFLATNSALTSDKFLLWTGDDTPPGVSWQSYWYWIGNGSYSTRWVKLGDANFSDQNSLPLKHQRAFMLQLQGARPLRVVPRPWMP